MEPLTLIAIGFGLFVVVLVVKFVLDDMERKRIEEEERERRDSWIGLAVGVAAFVAAVGAVSTVASSYEDSPARRPGLRVIEEPAKPKASLSSQSDWRLLPVDPELWYNQSTGESSSCVPDCVDDAYERAQRRECEEIVTDVQREGSFTEPNNSSASRMDRFERNNQTYGLRIIDLHGLFVSEALHKLHKRLTSCRRFKVERLLIITGWGKHSPGNVARIRPAAIDLLREEGLDFTEPANPGCIGVTF